MRLTLVRLIHFEASLVRNRNLSQIIIRARTVRRKRVYEMEVLN